MIISNTKQMHEFLPSLNLTLENDRFKDFLVRAQEWLVKHVIGTDIEETLEIDIEVGQTDPHKALRDRCQRVIAERALLDAIPELDMQLTEAGFAVQSNDKMSPASSQRVDRLLQQLPQRIANDVDSVVDYLLENSKTEQSAYSDWRATEQFKYLTVAFMPTMYDYNQVAVTKVTDFDTYYNIIPKTARAMKEVAAYYVSRAEIDRLIELSRGGELLDVHKEAIYSLRTVAAFAQNNMKDLAVDAAKEARRVMMDMPDFFPAFKASEAYSAKSVNIDGGKVVNFL